MCGTDGTAQFDLQILYEIYTQSVIEVNLEREKKNCFCDVQHYHNNPVRENHEDDLKAGAPPLRGQAKRAGALQLGEEKTPRRPYSGLPVPEGGLQERWGGTFYKSTQ